MSKSKWITQITREELYQLYWEENISIPKIAARYHQTYDIVLGRFCAWNIPRKANGAFCKKYLTPEAYQEGKRKSSKKYREKPGIQHRVYTQGSRRWQIANETNREKTRGRARKCGKKRYAKTISFVERVKRIFGCCECGCKDPVMLDFHHRDRQTKGYSIGKRLSFSISQLKKEMRKCDVICVNCHREKHTTNRLYSHTHEYVNRVALWYGCKICGYRKWAPALEFHHRDPRGKEFHISKCNGKSISLIKDEIRKCDILCGNCHRKHHWQQRHLSTSNSPQNPSI